MKIYLFNILIIACPFFCFAQDYKINFSGSGVSSNISTVLVENLTQGTSLTFEGSSTLLLHSWATGISDLSQNVNKEIHFYPNPMNESSQMEFYLSNSGKTQVEIIDVSGRIIAKIENNLSNGLHRYQLSGLGQGLFIIQIQAGNKIESGKLICNNVIQGEPKIKYLETNSLPVTKNELKNATTEVSMQYNSGDLLKVTGSSGKHKTVVMNTPTGDRTIKFKFIACIDADENSYSVVEIGNQWWMAENLKATKYMDGTNIPLVAETFDWQDLSYNDDAYCWYKNNIENKELMGALYNWYAVTKKQLCPVGWHVPINNEWDELETFLGGEDVAGGKLKDIGTAYWKNPNYGATNETGFSALPANYREHQGMFLGDNKSAGWWSSTEGRWGTGSAYHINNEDGGLYGNDGYDKNFGNSIRCVKGESSSTTPTTPTAQKPSVTTNTASSVEKTSAILNGNVSSDGGKTITQRGFYWSQIDNTPDSGDNVVTVSGTTGSFNKSISGLAENTTYYYRSFATNSEGTSTGDVVSFKTKEEETGGTIAYGSFKDSRDNITYKTVKIGDQTWMAENLAYKASSGCWVYDDKESNASYYGRLYNWEAAKSACPNGWHLPSDDEWKKLEIEIGMSQTEVDAYKYRNTDKGIKLKAENGWSDGGNGTNNYGFSLLPGGLYADGTGYLFEGGQAYLWTSSENGKYAWMRRLTASDNDIYRADYVKSYGFSIRCLKD